MLSRNIDVVQVIVFFASCSAKQDSSRVVVSIDTVAQFVKTIARFVKRNIDDNFGPAVDKP
jgi:hypothetical protein